MRQQAPGTAAEIDRVLRLLGWLGARHVVLGSSRDDRAMATVAALAEEWESTGGTVLATVDWPEQAASWLRQARRFTTHGPDAWVVTGEPGGWLRMARRLAQSTCWSPARTVATASLDVPEVRGATELLAGLRGATRDGLLWTVGTG